MLKQSWPLRALTLGLISLFLVGLTLVACGGANEPAAEEAVAPAETEEVVATPAEVEEVAEAEEPVATEELPEEKEAPAAAETEAPATGEATAQAAEPAPEENPSAATTAPAAECQTVEVPDNELIAAVADSDWVKGPAGAPITLIEYGDFQ
jgi:hypothetical protein